MKVKTASVVEVSTPVVLNMHDGKRKVLEYNAERTNIPITGKYMGLRPSAKQRQSECSIQTSRQSNCTESKLGELLKPSSKWYRYS